jgi:hypothetical protein
VSKFETSVSDLITGIKGGLYYFFNKISQLTFKNHGWSLTLIRYYIYYNLKLLSFVDFVPSLLSGFLINKPSNKFLHYYVRVFGYFNYSYLILSNNYSLFKV